MFPEKGMMGPRDEARSLTDNETPGSFFTIPHVSPLISLGQVCHAKFWVAPRTDPAQKLEPYHVRETFCHGDKMLSKASYGRRGSFSSWFYRTQSTVSCSLGFRQTVSA